MLTWHFLMSKTFFIINLDHVDINLVLFIFVIRHVSFFRF